MEDNDDEIFFGRVTAHELEIIKQRSFGEVKSVNNEDAKISPSPLATKECDTTNSDSFKTHCEDLHKNINIEETESIEQISQVVNDAFVDVPVRALESCSLISSTCLSSPKQNIPSLVIEDDLECIEVNAPHCPLTETINHAEEITEQYVNAPLQTLSIRNKFMNDEVNFRKSSDNSKGDGQTDVTVSPISYVVNSDNGVTVSSASNPVPTQSTTACLTSSTPSANYVHVLQSKEVSNLSGPNFNQNVWPCESEDNIFSPGERPNYVGIDAENNSIPCSPLSDSGLDESGKCNLSTTFEDIEMMMKYGVKYMLSVDDSVLRKSIQSESAHQSESKDIIKPTGLESCQYTRGTLETINSSVSHKDLKKYNRTAASTKTHVVKTSAANAEPSSCPKPLLQVKKKMYFSDIRSPVAEYIKDRPVPLLKTVVNVKSHENNDILLRCKQESFIKPRGLEPCQDIRSAGGKIISSVFHRDLKQHNHTGALTKTPVSKTSAANADPSSCTKPSPQVKKKMYFSDIRSPVAAYIKNRPVPLLKTVVKVKSHENDDILLRCKQEPFKPSIKQTGANNPPALPEVRYENAPVINIKQPRSAERRPPTKSLLPTPTVIRHAGRAVLATVPQNVLPFKHAEVSVVFDKNASRTATL